MAGAVAHALIRTVLGRSANSPSSSPSSSPSRISDILTPFARRRSSSAMTTTSTSSAVTTATTIQPQPQPQPQPQQPSPDPRVESSPLSIATAAIGLIAASHHTFHDIETLNVAPRTLTASLQTLLVATKSLKLTAQLAYKWLRRVETTQALPYDDRAALIDVDAVIVILAEAAEAVSEAGNVLENVVRAATAAAARVSDVVPDHAPAIVNVSERIERVENLLSKLLTILRISSLAEALSARATVDTALVLIMGENVALAESIRSMPDVFNARALVSPARLAALLARPPPSYSVPAPSVPEALPGYSAATPSDTHPDGSVTIRPQGWSVFAALTLADLCILSLVPLPFCAAELRYGEFYTNAFSRRVDPQLAELMERPSKSKAAQLAGILGSRSEAAAMADNENFARRVGMEVETPTSRDGRPRLRPQPNLIIGGP